jgi:two-component system, LytTR family, sensor kinase
MPDDATVSSPLTRDRAETRRNALILTALALLQGTLYFLYRYLELRAYRDDVPVLPTLINEFTGTLGGWALFLAVVLPVMRRWPVTRETWARRLPPYAALLLAFSAVHTTLNWGLRVVLYRLAGHGAYDYGRMPIRYLMELPIDATAYVLAATIAHLLWSHRAAHERELRAEQLERALAASQLRALRLQLQPHFLFNALNTIASTMYEDVPAADDMLTHLASLLRASLASTDVQVVPLAAELDGLRHYAAILHGRFGDRCALAVAVPEGCRDALVPSFVLQPLVENAVRHGRLATAGQGRIAVMAERTGEQLVLRVDDDGPGTTRDPWRANGGLGLRATADRLRLLFGDRQSMEAGNAAAGFRVTIRLPYTAGAARG